jgi:formylmethanofuran dehydrogenase subunit D
MSDHGFINVSINTLGPCDFIISVRTDNRNFRLFLEDSYGSSLDSYNISVNNQPIDQNDIKKYKLKNGDQIRIKSKTHDDLGKD